MKWSDLFGIAPDLTSWDESHESTPITVTEQEYDSLRAALGFTHWTEGVHDPVWAGEDDE